MDLRRMRKKGKGRKASREAGRAQVAETRDPTPLAPAPGPEAGAGAPEAHDPAGAPGPRAADVPDDADLREREEIAETMYRAALSRAEIAEAMYKAAVARAEVAEAMYKAAVSRADVADVREKAARALTAALEAREKAAAERDAGANARDRAALERDSLANDRDRASAQREAAAAARDAASVERDRVVSAREVALARGEAALAESKAVVADLRAATPASVTAELEAADAELERARLEAELQRAHLDALTGAFRREMGRLALRNEIDRARRGDGSFVIAFIDVDGLKGVNDREGHAAGDRILRTLVATMRANLRSYDPIVRFGGDEFIFGVAAIDPTEIQHRIGVIDQSLRSATGVGITAGLATLNPGESLDDLTARADAALIEAKRNRGQEEQPTF